MIVPLFKRKIIPQKFSTKLTCKENHNLVSSFKFEWATLIGEPSRKWRSINLNPADFTTGVAPNTYPKHILIDELIYSLA
jgi:hypothetical protein